MSDAPRPEELAASAAEFARGAGELLLGLFGKRVEVEYKDAAKTDPVSEADLASQNFLQQRILGRYIGHAVLGEEKPKDVEAAQAEGAQIVPEYLWVLDPLDGTKNFLNGLAVWGCSVGVLRRGRPVAGAVFTPEPPTVDSAAGAGGTVYRAWEGGGAWREERPIRVAPDEKPTGQRISSLPGSYLTQYRPTGPLKQSGLGEVRAPGSIAYELALVARGGLHFALFGAPSIWDVAAGVLLVKEAGGLPLIRRGGSDYWDPLVNFFPEEDESPRTLDLARKWRRAILVGNPGVSRFLAQNLRKVNRPGLWFRRRR
ncbi:MAG: inositol monophosphatase [Candidatus Tectomicrobia bacterium]|uniref:Inositol monophosphatase n=1 Tax=Tectimicrobiota bacterium TaxID=2528274 RepID=A0A932I354_UNCTE|nr:inositol monophosphatase [Candidatus Tectomicrobia bacterium]